MGGRTKRECLCVLHCVCIVCGELVWTTRALCVRHKKARVNSFLPHMQDSTTTQSDSS